MTHTLPPCSTSMLTHVTVHLSLLGGLWWSSVQSSWNSYVPGRSGQLGWRLRPQKQAWHLHKSHQIPWLDQRKDRSVEQREVVEQGHGHEHGLMTCTAVRTFQLMYLFQLPVVAAVENALFVGRAIATHFMSTVIFMRVGLMKCK